MPQSFSLKTIIHKIFVIISSLKWAWDFLVFHCFFQSSHSLEAVAAEIDSYCRRHGSDTGVECAVCLCGIEEDEEIRELKCSHIFHSVCFDRWVGYGRWTCPLCRNHLKFPRVDGGGEYIFHQVLVFNFCEIRTPTNERWWLR